MFERHPPNEIISEKYAPDVVAQVKLMYSLSHKETEKTKEKIMYIMYRPKHAVKSYKVMLDALDTLIFWVSSTQIKLTS